MHLIIPYAFSCSDGCVAALPALKLPNLHKLLARLSPLARDQGEELSLSPPHERALARALGLPVTDGLIAWAALQAAQRPELTSHGKAWSFVTLCHWRVNTQQVVMSHLPLPDLSAAQSDELLAAMRPYFEEDGIALHADQNGRWLAQADVFADIATASPDRVVGHNLDAWMPGAAAAAPLRRLQNEMQMLLYTHPINDAREAQGLSPVNSFWLSGTGALPGSGPALGVGAAPTVVDTLRQAALEENWPAWTHAWQDLDATQINSLLQAVARGQAVQITLCGERSSQSWQTRQQPVWQKFRHLFGAKPLSSLLEKL